MLKVLGQDVVQAYLTKRSSLAEAEVLRAWVYELKHWERIEPDHLITAFQKVDLSAAPRVVFHLSSAPLTIETLIDFRAGVVLITDIIKVS